jgi:hydroxymethylglutaryl-CoA lyase
MQHDVKEIAVFGSASEGFSQKNIGCSVAESLERFEDVVATALDHGIKVRGYISCVCGCPYDGAVSPKDVAKVIFCRIIVLSITLAVQRTVNNG